MIDGEGELSLEQCKLLTADWSVHSDSRPLVADRLWKEIAMLQAQLKNCQKILIACANKGCAICTGGISVGMPTECECPQDPPGSAHHAECPQHIGDEVVFIVSRPRGEMGVWDADGDWMPSPKCCDWCEEKKP